MRESNRHRDAWELLPWYVNGTLEDRDLDVVTTHLAECSVCRDEIARCRSLATAMQTAPEAARGRSVQGLERVLASIDAIEAAGTPEGGWRRWLRVPLALRELFQRTPKPLRWAFAAQTAFVFLLLSLATWQAAFAPGAPYRTLADSGVTDTGVTRYSNALIGRVLIHVVFSEDITEREIRALLGRVEGSIVEGPSAMGVYTVEIPARPPERVAAAVEVLRGDTKVRFAEQIRGH
jgi:hypothetical protein